MKENIRSGSLVSMHRVSMYRVFSTSSTVVSSFGVVVGLAKLEGNIGEFWTVFWMDDMKIWTHSADDLIAPRKLEGAIKYKIEQF